MKDDWTIPVMTGNFGPKFFGFSPSPEQIPDLSKEVGKLLDPSLEVRNFFRFGLEVVDEVEARGQKFSGRLELDQQTLPEKKSID